MTKPVPILMPKPPGPIVRAGAFLSKGVRSVMDQIEPYTDYWNQRNARDLSADGPLLVALGDSTSLGIGASHPSLSFTGQLAYALSLRDGTRWRIITLAQSGAKLHDGLVRQIPALVQLPDADLGTCCLGSNDLTWGLDSNKTREELVDLVNRLTPETIVCPPIGGSPRARSVNRSARAAADERGLDYVDVWHWTGAGSMRRLAADRFHPNEAGYALMCQALTDHLDAPGPDMDNLEAAIDPLV